MDIIAFPYFHDLKMKSGQEGGLSDGGVVCGSVPVTATPLDIAPVKGTMLGTVWFETPFSLEKSITFWNFGTVPATFDVYVVLEDGTEQLFVTGFVVAAPDMKALPQDWQVSYPNKLRFKLTNFAALDGRLRLKTLLQEFDTPSDLD
jgi:hypothetical protein